MSEIFLNLLARYGQLRVGMKYVALIRREIRCVWLRQAFETVGDEYPPVAVAVCFEYASHKNAGATSPDTGFNEVPEYPVQYNRLAQIA